MLIATDPTRTSQQTQRLEEQLVRDLAHLVQGNPRVYQQVLESLDAQVRERLPHPCGTRKEGYTLYLDNVTSAALAAIRQAGGSAEYNGQYPMPWTVILPARAVLDTLPLENGAMAYCINNGRDHLVVELMNTDTEYAYKGCDVLH